MLIRTTHSIRSEQRFFIPINSVGRKLRPAGDNAFFCEFPDIEIETAPGMCQTITMTATVLVGYFEEIPAPTQKPLS